MIYCPQLFITTLWIILSYIYLKYQSLPLLYSIINLQSSTSEISIPKHDSMSVGSIPFNTENPVGNDYLDPYTLSVLLSLSIVFMAIILIYTLIIGYLVRETSFPNWLIRKFPLSWHPRLNSWMTKVKKFSAYSNLLISCIYLIIISINATFNCLLFWNGVPGPIPFH